jgi:hypothetical protein
MLFIELFRRLLGIKLIVFFRLLGIFEFIRRLASRLVGLEQLQWRLLGMLVVFGRLGIEQQFLQLFQWHGDLR